MKSVLGIFLSSTLLSLVNSFSQLVPPTRTTAEMFPYHAIITTEIHWCSGALISETFVLTRATCCYNDTVENIYLGFSRNPVVEKNLEDKNGQIVAAEQIYLHEDFGYLLNSTQSVYNLALIKLDKAVVLSDTVKPIDIASRDDYPIPPGTFINQTGFLTYDADDNLRYATVQQNKIDICKTIYGNSFLASQERCVQQAGLERNTWAGPYVVNGVLIGLSRSIRAPATCQVTSPPCDVHDVYISIESSLLWIFRISGVAGVNSRALFEKENPFWNPEPEQPECPPASYHVNGVPLVDIISNGIHEFAQNPVCT